MPELDTKQYKFPDEEGNDVAFELEDEPIVEVEDDTPPEDRNRKPMVEPPKDFSDEELESYNESVKKRIQHFTKGYHEERRAKEAAHREREEALKLAQSVLEENKKLKGSLSQGQSALIEQAKKVVANEIEDAKRKYKEAYESGDAEALVSAQEELTTAKLKADRVNNFRPAKLVVLGLLEALVASVAEFVPHFFLLVQG